ncbi:hypothetical protein [Bacillus sp. FJAT-44742]|uniref:hypothetical protein n=1 Tax=Bacillus sp. FJAT-44742 TaxID=2014005 RepID=UPI000C24108A|nr:hypothetical protein [Bacillus sp. FJAT-44742]
MPKIQPRKLFTWVGIGLAILWCVAIMLQFTQYAIGDAVIGSLFIIVCVGVFLTLYYLHEKGNKHLKTINGVLFLIGTGSLVTAVVLAF